ncbi:hypothetical protein [Sulfurimonas sp.]|uniref:hypothetical protein n=1 Tax=Sulfurimonas sp. TaxID=2022749 RepID=UPI0025E1F942|nr:hypothetical protein [Sulfurimonas sp.]
MHYINITKDELKKSYIQGMLEADTIFTQGKEGEVFRSGINNAKSVTDLNEVVNGISKLYGINPLPFGLCLYDFKRGNCPNLGAQSCYMVGCSDFVTNETFLPNFENEINLLQTHITKCQSNNQVIEVKKATHQLNKLKTIIDKIN